MKKLKILVLLVLLVLVPFADAGTNFHTAWIDGTTAWSAASMNPALASLDAGISYNHNVIVAAINSVQFRFDITGGILSWEGEWKINFISPSTGKEIANKVAAGSVTIESGKIAYVDLVDTDNTTVTVTDTTFTPGTTTLFKTVSRVILGYVSSTDNRFHPSKNFPESRLTQVYTLTTSDATPTALITKALEEGKTYQVIAKVVAREGDVTNVASYIKTALVYRATGGSATLQGSVQDVATDVESNAAWDCTIDVNGNNVRVKVTGASTIYWSGTLEFIKV